MPWSPIALFTRISSNLGEKMTRHLVSSQPQIPVTGKQSSGCFELCGDLAMFRLLALLGDRIRAPSTPSSSLYEVPID